MRIGLDLDDTICSTSKAITKYAIKYCEEKYINTDFLWSDEENKNDFLNKYLEIIYLKARLKNNSKKVINELRKQGNQIFIITARSNRYINKNMVEFINEYFKRKGIKIDGIFINSKDKVDVCKKIKIDIILEDNLYNYEQLIRAGVNAVLYDESDCYHNINNKISNWNQFINIDNSN